LGLNFKTPFCQDTRTRFKTKNYTRQFFQLQIGMFPVSTNVDDQLTEIEKQRLIATLKRFRKYAS